MAFLGGRGAPHAIMHHLGGQRAPSSNGNNTPAHTHMHMHIQHIDHTTLHFTRPKDNVARLDTLFFSSPQPPTQVTLGLAPPLHFPIYRLNTFLWPMDGGPRPGGPPPVKILCKLSALCLGLESCHVGRGLAAASQAGQHAFS